MVNSIISEAATQWQAGDTPHSESKRVRVLNGITYSNNRTHSGKDENAKRADGGSADGISNLSCFGVE